MQDSSAKRLPGRPRSDVARSAILAAVNSLLEEVGFSKMTMEGIAARAGVAKTTLYRWWPNKGAVAVEAFMAAVEQRIAFPHTDSAVADIATQMLRLIEVYRGKTGRIVCELIALGQADPEILEAFMDGYMLPRRNVASQPDRYGAKWTWTLSWTPSTPPFSIVCCSIVSLWTVPLCTRSQISSSPVLPPEQPRIRGCIGKMSPVHNAL